MQGEVVKFGKADCRKVHHLARKRCENKIENNVRSKKVDQSKTETGVHVEGVAGEFACASVFDVDVNRNIDESGDDGYDLVIPPLTIEVKTRSGPGDFAMYNNSDDLSADIGILCWGIKNTNSVRVYGWISRTMWKVRAQTLYFGKQKRRGIKRKKMRPINELKNAFNVD
jgi:hypothetical protein